MTQHDFLFLHYGTLINRGNSLVGTVNHCMLFTFLDFGLLGGEVGVSMDPGPPMSSSPLSVASFSWLLCFWAP